MTSTNGRNVHSLKKKTEKVEQGSSSKDFLTEREFTQLLDATKHSRYPARDRAILMMLFWHGMRASELCDLRLTDLDLKTARVFFKRAKGSRDAHHPIRGDVLRAVKRYLRERPVSNVPWVFVSERGEPLTRKGVYYLVTTTAKRSALTFLVHPHMLRHGCGYEILEHTGDVRMAQEYLGHKDIKNTVRYTQISTKRFDQIWS